MSLSTEEVVADQSLEEWTFLEEEDAVAGREDDQYLHTGLDHENSADSAASSIQSSDIEVIEHDSDGETILNRSTTDQHGDRSETEYAMDWSFTDGDGTLDLSPGTKAYMHHPNDSVNFWLNLSVLVAVAAVAGMGIGNYVGTYMNWPRHSLTGNYQTLHLKNLQKQLDDCLHDKNLLSNSTLLNDMDSVLGFDLITATLTIGPQNQKPQHPLHLHESSQKSPPQIMPQSHERRVPQSEGNVPGQQLIVRKSSALMEDKAAPPPQLKSAITVPESAKRIVIQTSTTISFRSKDSSKRRGHRVLESEVEILLLLTDKGTSHPVFLSPEGRSQRKKVISSAFKPFLAKAFRGTEYVVWIDNGPDRHDSYDWTAVQVVSQENARAQWMPLRKMTKFFWSNLKKKMFKNWKGNDVSDFKERVAHVLSSLPESHFMRMFEKMEKKTRRAAAKMNDIRSKD